MITIGAPQRVHRSIGCCLLPDDLFAFVIGAGMTLEGARVYVLRDARRRLSGDGLTIIDERKCLSTFARVEVADGNQEQDRLPTVLRLQDATDENATAKLVIIPLEEQDKRRQIPCGSKEPTWNWTVESRDTLGSAKVSRTVVGIVQSGQLIRIESSEGTIIDYTYQPTVRL